MGLVAWTGRPDSRTGALMVSLGFAWVARYVVAVAVHPAFVAGVLLGSVYLSILVHLLATFPDGRLHGPVERAVVVVGYLLSAPLDLFFLVVFSADRGLGEGPPPNGLVIAPTNGEFDPASLDLVVQAVVVLLFVTLLAIVFGRWRAAGPALRRSLGPAVVGGAVIVLTILVERTAILLLIPPGLGVVFAWSAQVVLVLWPLALLLGLLRAFRAGPVAAGPADRPAEQPARPFRRRPARGRARFRRARSCPAPARPGPDAARPVSRARLLAARAELVRRPRRRPGDRGTA